MLLVQCPGADVYAEERAMSTNTSAWGLGSPPPPFPVRRFTVDEYHRMIQAGILTEDDRVELLEGWIVPKMAHNPPHDCVLTRADEAIRALLPNAWRLRVQCAITTADSEPEPDLAVVLGPSTRYATRHPGPPDIGLLVEVSDSTLAHDRTDKGRLYAKESIPVYWIINVIDARVEVYTDPTGPGANPGYRQRQDYGLQDDVPLLLAGQVAGTLPVTELLG
jgi:Uma2 family endonuclease